MGKRELIALLNLSSWCLVMVERLFHAVPRGCLQFVIVVFPDHTHLLFQRDFDGLQTWEARWNPRGVLWYFILARCGAIMLVPRWSHEQSCVGPMWIADVEPKKWMWPSTWAQHIILIWEVAISAASSQKKIMVRTLLNQKKIERAREIGGERENQSIKVVIDDSIHLSMWIYRGHQSSSFILKYNE